MKSHNPTLPASAAALVLGAGATLSQVALGREFLCSFTGNELFLALVLVAWFGGTAAGSRMARSRRRPGDAALLAVAALPLAGLAGLLAVRLAPLWLGLEAGRWPGPWMACGALFAGVFPVAALSGLALPLLAGKAGAGGGGRVYAWDVAGSALAGAFFTFGLVGRVPAVVILPAASLVGAAVLWALPGWEQGLFRRATGGLALLLLAGLATGLFFRVDAGSRAIRWERAVPGYGLLARTESRAGLLEAGERDGQRSLFADGVWIGSFPDPWGMAPIHLALNQVPHPRRVLLAGGGLLGPAQLALRYPVDHVDVVEPDPDRPGFERALLPSGLAAGLADARCAILAEDPFPFLAHPGPGYDLIVLLLPPPLSVAGARFGSVEFMETCRDRLNPGGALAVWGAGNDTYLGEEMGRGVGSLWRTLREVFPVVLAVPGERTAFFACQRGGPATVDPGELGRRFALQGPRDDATFSPVHFRLLLPADRVEWLNSTLSSLPGEAAREDRPVSLRAALGVWGQTVESAGARILATSDVPWVLGLALPSMAALVLGFASGRKGKGDLPVLGAVWGFGLFGMGAEFLVLYRFQTRFGSLYSDLGLLVALFMAGLGAGAWLGRRPTPHAQRCLALLFLPAAVLAGTLLLPVPAGLQARGLFTVQLLVAGALTGAAFPLACSALERGEGQSRNATARVNAWDHMGGLAGAALTGTVALPLWGLKGTSLLLLLLLVLVPSACLLGGHLGEISARRRS